MFFLSLDGALFYDRTELMMAPCPGRGPSAHGSRRPRAGPRALDAIHLALRERLPPRGLDAIDGIDVIGTAIGSPN